MVRPARGSFVFSSVIRMSRRLTLAAAFLFPASILVATLVTSAGCGPGLHQVTGEVKLNGAPLPNASVQFHPVDEKGALDRKRSTAVGQTDAAGKFTLKTANQDYVGVFAGAYKATVEAKLERTLTDAQKAFPGASIAVPIKSLVAPEYTEVSKTPLTFTIPSATPIVLEVKPPAK